MYGAFWGFVVLSLVQSVAYRDYPSYNDRLMYSKYCLSGGGSYVDPYYSNVNLSLVCCEYKDWFVCEPKGEVYYYG